MTSFSSLQVRLVGTIFIAIAAAGLVMHFTHLESAAVLVGIVALGAAWVYGERLILPQTRALFRAAQGLAAGDLSSRTGLSKEGGELGQFARTFDAMAASLEQRVKEREASEKA